MPLTAFGESDVGMHRDSNEDSFGVLPSAGLFMVADGMGGTAAGEVASRLVVHEVRNAVDDGDTTWWPETSVTGPDSAPRRFMSGIHRGNRRILTLASRDRRKRGMGTTFAGLLVLPRSAMIAHVGDSRVYRLRSGKLGLLTHDHTLVNELIDRGFLNPEDAATSPRRHVLTRAVGVLETVEVDARIVDTRPGDVFLICSDGLHGELSDEEIAAVLTTHADPEFAVLRLIQLANQKGGRDNVTAVVVRIDEPG
jgi:protein phosphatase